jgi:hypothetical protein
MKQLSLITGALLVCGSLLAADADPKADVKAAGKKLGNNYSWNTTTKLDGAGNFQPGPAEGRTADGWIYMKTTFGERTIESVIKGNKAATQTQDGWQNVDELEGNRAFLARRLKTFKAPADEAADLADKAKSLKKDGDAIIGDLTEDGAKDLLSLGGRRPNADANNARPGPKDAKGSVKFWVKDGALTKYEFNVQGKVTFQEEDRTINRTTTVEIKDVGKTKANVPEDAKKKVS